MARRLVLAVLVAGAAACSGGMPGGEVGTYRVTATPQANTCGVGPGAPNPWVFFVHLTKDSQSLYWSWQDGSPPASGTLTAQSAKLVGTQSESAGKCTLKRDDAMTVNLGAGDNPKSFEGTITYAFTAADGTCTAALTAGGGPYDMLPCSITYAMTGARQ
jgi:hypothetical protein